MAIDRKQVEEIVRAVGGKENIEAATHCVTRLRFALYDESKVDTEGLDQNDLVKGQFSSQGQFQVVIGPGLVDKVYDEMIQITGGDRASKDDVKAAAGKSKIRSNVQSKRCQTFYSDPACHYYGRSPARNQQYFDRAGHIFDEQSLVDVYPAWKDLASIINTIASTAFTFLPALIGWAAVKDSAEARYWGLCLG